MVISTNSIGTPFRELVLMTMDVAPVSKRKRRGRLPLTLPFT